MDPHEEKIVAILRYGPKKKVEIVTLMQNYKADKTTRNRIDDLEERGVIEEEEDSKRLYLSEGEKTMVRPKPFADQEEVNRVLFNIEEELGCLVEHKTASG